MSSDDFYRGEQPVGQQTPPPPPPGYGPPAYQQQGYQQQGYQQPGYGSGPGYPPGYGPPGYAPPPYGPPPYGRPTNTMAILALVLAFAFAPAGLILGIIARKQIKQTGEQGDGLALAGIIIGAIATALFVLGIVLWIVMVASIANGSFGP